MPSQPKRGVKRGTPSAPLATGAPAEKMLRTFIAKFSPADQTRIRAARREMRRQVAGAYELIYDNYNFFVIGYGPTERPSEAIVSLAAQADRIALCFLHGKKLPDPAKLLRGSGNQVRSMRLESAADLARPQVRALISEGFARGVAPLRGGPVTLIIRSISAKQRPRRKG